MTWKKGESGNPAGKKPGLAKLEPLRQAIRDHLPDIIAALLAQAKAGDVAAARLLLERCYPPLKAVQEPLIVPLQGESLTARALSVIDAVATGILSPGDAKTMLDGLAAVGKIRETDELVKRVEALEAMQT